MRSGLTHPRRTKVQHGTFLRFGHPRLKNFSVRLLATSTKICTMGSSTVSHENRFKASLEKIISEENIFNFSFRRKKNNIKYTHTQLLMIFSPTHSYVFLFHLFVLMEWSSVGQSNMHCCHTLKKVFMWNCLSAIRFRGGVILQVSCYTLLTPIPTSVATVLMSTPHGTPFRLSEGWSRYALALLILRTSGWIPHRQNCLPVMAHYESSILAATFDYLSKVLWLFSLCSHRFKVWEKAEVVKIRPTDTSSHCFTLNILKKNIIVLLLYRFELSWGKLRREPATWWFD